MVQVSVFACFASVLLFEKVKCPSEGADGHFNKGIFMKKFLRKDTYIILLPTPSVNRFQDNLQLFHI